MSGSDYSVVVSVFAIIILSIIGGLFRVCAPTITGCYFPRDDDLGRYVFIRGHG